MKKIQTLSLLLFLLIGISTGPLLAQDEAVTEEKAKLPTPPNMWEISPGVGILFVGGDVGADFGYAGILSVRKSLDYIFSLRFDAMYGQANGESDRSVRMFKTNWMAGTLLGVLSLNSVRFNRPVRNSNIYVMIGAGGDYFKVVEYRNEEKRGSIDAELMTHAALGAGVSFRLSPRINIGLEHQAQMGFGRRSDLIDGSELESGIRTPFRDIVNFTSLRVNINIGNKQRRSEPLYWINPLQVVLDDIQELKSQSGVALQDSDGDGVIDQLDNEPSSAPGAMVDTKGRTLDSDRDGIPDHLDREPYYTPREGEQVDENGVVTNPIGGSGGVTEDRVRELIDEALQNYQPSGRNAGIADLFLPMLHFGINSTTIKYSDYGTLASIARVLRDNPNIRLVIKGYTDQTGTETFNQVLSYERAKAIIDHLTNNHAIGRGRLVLQYGGQNDALVPDSSSYMNRRVEFSVAKPGDVEMDPPAGYDPNKKSGY